jgi:hypothetical protein
MDHKGTVPSLLASDFHAMDGDGGRTARRIELAEARRALVSLLGKCGKTLPKLEGSKAQHTLMARRIRAFEVSIALIDQELERI